MKLLSFLFPSSRDVTYSGTAFLLLLYAIFYQNLLPELKACDKTVIAISHDDHVYSLADRIVKLTDGAIEYDGPASALFEPSVCLALEKPGQGFSHA